ncbi:MAG: hypothetical protein ABUL62_18705 [Myxococcales bacterium]
MAHPVATLFALTMAVWVADVRLAPQAQPVAPASAAACHSGPEAAPADSDAEVVVCASRLK